MISQIMTSVQKKHLVICWVIKPPNRYLLKKEKNEIKLKWNYVWQGKKNEDGQGKLIKET